MYRRYPSSLQATRKVDGCVGKVSMFWVWTSNAKCVYLTQCTQHKYTDVLLHMCLCTLAYPWDSPKYTSVRMRIQQSTLVYFSVSQEYTSVLSRYRISTLVYSHGTASVHQRTLSYTHQYTSVLWRIPWICKCTHAHTQQSSVYL